MINKVAPFSIDLMITFFASPSLTLFYKDVV